MSFATAAVLTGVVLVLAMVAGILAFMEIGHRAARRRMARAPESAHKGLGLFEGATYGLMSLFIAFIFSGASQRFETRRNLAVQEANAIGTAYLRVDLVPAEAQPAIRACFRQYLDARLALFRSPSWKSQSARDAMARASALQKEIWNRSVAAVKVSPVLPAAVSLLPALNEMIVLTTTRHVAENVHPPLEIYLLLCILMFASALLMGYGMAGGGRRWLHLATFAAVLALSMYVILDFEFPRLGLIQNVSVDQLLVDLRAAMGN